MSGECESCGEHDVDCKCEQKSIYVSLKFQMPYNGTLEIIASEPVNEFEIGAEEVIKGITYSLCWNGKYLPWCTKTKSEAIAMAFACQYGAQEVLR